MSNKNTKCVHIYFERYAETGTTQCLWWHCNTSSLVVVPLMGVETALAALKVSQSPYRGAPVIVVVNTKVYLSILPGPGKASPCGGVLHPKWSSHSTHDAQQHI